MWIVLYMEKDDHSFNQARVIWITKVSVPQAKSLNGFNGNFSSIL